MKRDPRRGSVAIRLLTAGVLIPIVLALLWVPALHVGFVLFVAAFAFIGAREYYQLAKAKGHNPEAGVGELACAILACAAWWNNLNLILLVFFITVLVAAWLHIVRGHPSMDDLAVTVFGLVYIGLIAAHFTLLQSVEVVGPGLVTMTLAAIALSDTGAYFTGKSIGRHKMAPRVSPGKTWEGSAGGFVWAAAGMAIIYAIRVNTDTPLLPDWTLLRYVVVGLVLAMAGQVGDLVESMLKRDAGVKDSGAILPGHGGVLDRCDGFLFAAPVMYYLLIV
ncbi:MAG: hypothetical protein RLZZ303_752 [Candidatus Hydrogenedentota bacterium]|jgi:phosphatidate cytidylyltransferase